MPLTGADSAPAVDRPTAISVLIVDDEDATRDPCAAMWSPNPAGALERPRRPNKPLKFSISIPSTFVITDLKVPQLGGLELLKRIRETYPQTAVIVLTQYGTIESAVEATRMGPRTTSPSRFTLRNCAPSSTAWFTRWKWTRRIAFCASSLRTRPGFGGLIGVSPKMQRVYRLIEKVSQHNYPVLILGESGTGQGAGGALDSFLGHAAEESRLFPVDCSSLVPTLIESELFGYVKGAFTGAMHAKTGLMESAGSGTLFLDEIGDLPVDLQAKLSARLAGTGS